MPIAVKPPAAFRVYQAKKPDGVWAVLYDYTPVHGPDEGSRISVEVVEGLSESQAAKVTGQLAHAYYHGKLVGRRWTAEHMGRAMMNQARMLAGMPVEMNDGALEDA
jgi:hypothetical protein